MSRGHPMMAKIAVICAYNNKNPGMYTVDLSALGFFRGWRFRLFQVEPLERFGKIRYRRLDGIESLESLEDFQHIVFWGDFQNNPIWGVHDFAQRRVRKSASPDLESARREWVALYLRIRERVGRNRTLMSLGTCFLGADGDDYRELYGQDLRYFTDSFDLIVPRDPLSTEVVRRLGGTRAGATLIEGMDPVFFADHLPASNGKAKGRFGHFFHRSQIGGTEGLVSAVAGQSRLRPQCLRWFGLKNDWFTHWRYRGLIRQLLACQFVITDVYHMAATCLKMGIPAIGIGRGGVLQSSTLSDLKKKALFASLRGEDDYVETEGDTITPTCLSAVLERSERIQSKGGLDPVIRQALHEKPGAIKTRIHAAFGA